jgi:hypothetical protein
MDNIRTNMGTDFTAIVVDNYNGEELAVLCGNLCNPDEVATLAEFLKKWADNSEVTVDLSID